MQESHIFVNSLFKPECYEYVEVNNFGNTNYYNNKAFYDGILNSKKIIKCLEKSILKTNKYEEKLMRCKARHSHTHLSQDLKENDNSERKESKSLKCDKTDPIRSTFVSEESWSTMSLICLQYQYEELSKRYESLLREYHDRCNTLKGREVALAQVQEQLQSGHAQLTQTHAALLSIGDKFLALRQKKLVQKSQYEKRIKDLRSRLYEVMLSGERARLEVDEQLNVGVTSQHDSAVALLLAEIKKCNLLFLENLRLKSRIEEKID